MGFDLHLVKSEERYYGAFVCAICQCLIDTDGLVTTVCSHCFCTSCLPLWLEKSNHINCPTCNQDLLYAHQNQLHQQQQQQQQNHHHNQQQQQHRNQLQPQPYHNHHHYPSMMIGNHSVLVQPLQSAQPLAHRLLKSLLVSCPLQSSGVNCSWQGDYGDLESHLLSSTAHSSLPCTTTTTPKNTAAAAKPITATTMHPDSTTRSNNHDDDDKDDVIPMETTSDATPASPPPPPPQQQQQQPPNDWRQQFEQHQQQQYNLALSLKTQANGKFESKHFPEALSLYTKAMQVLEQAISMALAAPSTLTSMGQEEDATRMDEDRLNASEMTNVITHQYLSRARELLHTLYSNRAATYYQLQNYESCLQDCQAVMDERNYPSLQSLSNNGGSTTDNGTTPVNVKVYIRAARACIQLGSLEQARHILEACRRKELLQQASAAESGTNVSSSSSSSTLVTKELQKTLRLEQQSREAQSYLQEQAFASAKGAFGRLLQEAPSAIPFLLGAAEADLGLGLTDSSLRLTKRVLMKHAQNPKGCWLRGQTMFFMNEYKVALQLLQEALRLDPDSARYRQSYKQAKRVHEWLTQAKSCIFSRQFQNAVDLLTNAIDSFQPHHPEERGQQQAIRQTPLPPKTALYATLYTQRAEAYLRLKQYDMVKRDCAKVVYYQEDAIPTWLILFQAHHGLGEHSTALEQIKDLLQKWPQDRRLGQAYERADFLLRKEKRVDYYQLLGVPSIASEMEIKKAYKRKALELHPDKVLASLPPETTPEELEQARKKAQKQFQVLGEGLEILCDDFQRKLYDEGYDEAAIRERVEAAKQAARNHRGYPHGGGH